MTVVHLPQPRETAFWYRGIPLLWLAEHDWARALDRLGVPWVFLGEQRPVAGSFVAAPFWLPASRQYLYIVSRVEQVIAASSGEGRFHLFAAGCPPRPFTSEEGWVPDLRLVIGDEEGRFLGISRDGVHRATRATGSVGTWRCPATRGSGLGRATVIRSERCGTWLDLEWRGDDLLVRILSDAVLAERVIR